MAEIKQIRKRSGVLVPFNKGRISNAIYRAAVAVGGRDKEKAEELADQVIKLLTKDSSNSITPAIEEILDPVEKVLIENGHAKVAKAFILYREEANKRRESSARKASHPSENIPWAKLHRILDWSVTKNLFTITQLNERIRLGEFSQILHESETAYEEVITQEKVVFKQLSTNVIKGLGYFRRQIRSKFNCVIFYRDTIFLKEYIKSIISVCDIF